MTELARSRNWQGIFEHGVDERVHMPSVTETAQAIALFIRDWCGLARR